MTSKRPRRSNLKNQCIFDLKTKLRPWNVMEYVIQAVKISFQLEKLSKVFFIESSKIQHLLDMRLQRLCKEDNPKIDCPCINLPYSGSQKSMAFAQNVIFSLKNVGLKQDKASLNTLYVVLSKESSLFSCILKSTHPRFCHSGSFSIQQCTINCKWKKLYVYFWVIFTTQWGPSRVITSNCH